MFHRFKDEELEDVIRCLHQSGVPVDMAVRWVLCLKDGTGHAFLAIYADKLRNRKSNRLPSILDNTVNFMSADVCFTKAAILTGDYYSHWSNLLSCISKKAAA